MTVFPTYANDVCKHPELTAVPVRTGDLGHLGSVWTESVH